MSTLLALLIPEADEFLHPLRVQWEPAARRGLGAHITLLYPFLPLGTINAERLSEVASTQTPIAFHLREIHTFRSTVWLAPTPDGAIVSLARALAEGFPDRPKPRQPFPHYVPHVSVARGAVLFRDRTMASLAEALNGREDAIYVCREFALLCSDGGRWRVEGSFPLG